LQEILEDVHESLAAPDNKNTSTTTTTTTTTTKTTTPKLLKMSSNNPGTAGGSGPLKSLCAKKSDKSNSSAVAFDSIAALTEIMDPSSHITIPATGIRADQEDADSSSTKTEMEEMEMDAFSDGEESGGNGNNSAACGSVSFAARQLKPLSIYRHNPAFHSQHVSVNQMDEIPPLSPTSLEKQPQMPTSSSSSVKGDDNNGTSSTGQKLLSSKARRKKKVILQRNRSINIIRARTKNFFEDILCHIAAKKVI
jgi:hypothetical protein